MGVSTDHLALSEQEIFEDLMCVSNLRGSIGAGIATWSRHTEDTRRLRTQHNGINLVNTEAYFNLMKYTNDRPSTLIGHTRAPTRGGLSIDSVHPHSFPNLIGVHNGTMHRVDGKPIETGVSDSFELYRTISEKGLQSFVQNSEGAYALSWIDKEEGTLNFIRNFDRPLCFAWTSSGRTMYWASERIMLEMILQRKNLHKFAAYMELPPNEHWVFDLKQKGEVRPVSTDSVRKIQAFQEMGLRSHYEYLESQWDKELAAYQTKKEEKPEVKQSVIGPANNPDDSAIVTELKSRPVKWIFLGKAVTAAEDHGAPVSCKSTIDNKWQMAWGDGAISEYDHYPYYIWRSHVQKLLDATEERKARQQSLADRMREHKAKKEAEKATPPFGTESSEQSASSEAGADCNLEEHRHRQDELDKVFGEADPLLEDSLPWEDEVEPTLFKQAHAKANGQRGPRISKKEKRRIRAVQRLEAAKLQQEIEKAKLESSGAGWNETFRNCFLTDNQLRNALASGCSSCGNNGCEPSEVTWHSRNEFLCDTCSQDFDARAAAGLAYGGPTVH